MSADVFILGGYGNTGTLIAEGLLADSDIRVHIGGRSLEKARAEADRLNGLFGEARARPVRTDAADPNSLRQAFHGVDVVVAASSTARYTEQVARASLDTGADYLDTQLSFPSKLAALRLLEPEIRAAGLCFVTDAGFHPGLPAAMVRLAAERLPRLERANVCSCIRMDWSRYGFSADTAPEMMEELRDYRPRFFRYGRRQENWLRALRADFAPPLGRRWCAPMEMDEMNGLPPAIPTLRETGFYVSGFDPVTSYVVMPLGYLAMKLRPEWALRPVADVFMESARRFSRPPFMTELRLDAVGRDETGGERRLSVSVRHEDGYLLTAVPVAACLKQMLGGGRRAGLWHQGWLVEPEPFFEELRRRGVTVEVGG